MKQDFIKTPTEISFYPKIMQMDDRELQEFQALQLYEINKSNEKTRLNVQFFFWVTIVSFILTAFVFFASR